MFSQINNQKTQFIQTAVKMADRKTSHPAGRDIQWFLPSLHPANRAKGANLGDTFVGDN